MTEQELFKWKLGARIKLKRCALGITQSELAVKIGYSDENGKTMISKIESGKTEPPISKLASFATALDTSVAYLMGWNEETEITPEERQIITWYRKASEFDKGRIYSILESYEKSDTNSTVSA